MLSTIADVPAQIAEQKLNASISTIRNVVNSTTNLNYSTKLSSKEEMYVKVFNRANESVDTIELIKAQTGAEKTLKHIVVFEVGLLNILICLNFPII
jgi:hypothetical protein